MKLSLNDGGFTKIILIPVFVILTIIGSVLGLSLNDGSQFNMQKGAMSAEDLDANIQGFQNKIYTGNLSGSLGSPGENGQSLTDSQILDLLQAHSWQLIYLEKQKPGTINFNKDGKFDVFICNSGNGSYNVQKANLKISDLGLTKKYCPNLMEAESAFASMAKADSAGFKIEILQNNEIALFDTKARNLLMFKLQVIN